MFNECNVEAKRHEIIIKQKKMQITQTQAAITAEQVSKRKFISKSESFRARVLMTHQK